MTQLFVRRIFAFSIDYLMIVAYGIVLYFVSTYIQSKLNINLSFDIPVKRQALGFITLTLPVFIYFYFSEKGKARASIGKRFMNLIVVRSSPEQNSYLLIRNFLKFLPWGVAHFGVHYAMEDNEHGTSTSYWVWFLLIAPQAIVVVYFLTMFFSKGESSFYDKISNTKISG